MVLVKAIRIFKVRLWDFVGKHLLKFCDFSKELRKTTWTGKKSSTWDDQQNWTNGIPENKKVCHIPPSLAGENLPILRNNIFIDYAIYNKGSIYNEGNLNIQSRGIFQNEGYFENRPTASLVNYGNINNLAIFQNRGTLENRNVIVNEKIFENDGHISNEHIIGNRSLFTNNGFIDNYHVINNIGTFEDFGTIESHDNSSFNNAGEIIKTKDS